MDKSQLTTEYKAKLDALQAKVEAQGAAAEAEYIEANNKMTEAIEGLAETTDDSWEKAKSEVEGAWQAPVLLLLLQVFQRQHE
jgi:hypothetical protein